MTTTSAKEKIKALLEKRGFTEKSTKEGLFTVDTGASKVGVELFGERPIVGIFINNKLEEDGHGVEAVLSLRSQVLAVWDREINRGVSEQPAPKPEPDIERAKVAKNEPEPKPQPKPAEVVKPKGDEKMEPKPETKEAEIIKENLPARRQEFKVGTCEAVAIQYGIPSELANLFFMKMNEGLYIKNPGLLYLAGKKGYSRIEITDKYDQTTQEWSAECRIYPKVSKEILEGISKLDKEMQKSAFDFLTNPTNGTGRASKNNVKMSTMQSFLREMAQTRAQNRALRAFTGYGGTSAEELPEGHIEEQ